jgi:hypothetical protein
MATILAHPAYHPTLVPSMYQPDLPASDESVDRAKAHAQHEKVLAAAMFLANLQGVNFRTARSLDKLRFLKVARIAVRLSGQTEGL